MRTDAEVIRSSLVRPRAFEEIFDRHFDPIRGYLTRRVGRDDGDDLAAEVFARAFEVRDRYDLDRPNARPWLYGIAANLLSHHLRSRARRDLAFARAAARTTGHEDLEHVAEQIDADRDVGRVLDAVARMEPQDRELLLLSVWEGLAYTEIAEALRLPLGTVRSRLHRARRGLRESIRTPVLPGRSADHA